MHWSMDARRKEIDCVKITAERHSSLGCITCRRYDRLTLCCDESWKEGKRFFPNLFLVLAIATNIRIYMRCICRRKRVKVDRKIPSS